MIEWATGSPWWAFLFFVLALTTLENIVKYVTKKFKGNSEDDLLAMLEQARISIEAKEIRIKTLEVELHLAKIDIDRYKKLYQEQTRATDWKQQERQQAYEARRARTRYAGHGVNFEDIMRAKEAMDAQSNSYNWDEIRAKYRADMKANHPDAIQARGGSAADIASATANAQRINEQYKKDKARFGK